MASSSASWSHLTRCESTNDEACRLGRAGAPEGTVVTASEQTGGRGRLGRIWHSPPGENLYLSLLLRPPLPPHRAPLLCLCAGLALHQTATALFNKLAEQIHRPPPRLLLKWPNDLLAEEIDGPRKLGGVLTELFCAGSTIEFVVVGVGCNVNSATFPSELKATSLRLLAGPTADPLEVRQFAEQLVEALQHFYQRYLVEGAAPIVAAFSEAAGLGENHPPITVHTATQQLQGTPIGLGSDGELLLRTTDGRVERIMSGEVTLPGPRVAGPQQLAGAAAP